MTGKRGNPNFVKGVSGNPGGLTKEHRAKRLAVRTALETAFVKEGIDTLVNAIVEGVQAGDSSIIRLACEYRWGKPTEHHEVTDGDGEPLGLVVSFVRPEEPKP
jgi:hypothetical protein